MAWTPMLESASCVSAPAEAAPTRAELDAIVRMKYGDPSEFDWGPRMRWQAGYFTPDDVYEALVARLVTAGCAWADVGCGRELLPNNKKLARMLANYSGVLVGVDPSENVEENPYVHKRARCSLEAWDGEQTFDLVTLRMVAEHIADPGSALASLARMTRPGGKVVVFTVNCWTPVALAAWLVPFQLHHRVKHWLWGTEEKDTFPVAYRLNTRRALERHFAAHGFREAAFHYLDDCRTTGRFYWLQHGELLAQRCLRAAGLAYPENCLLGVYERLPKAD